ncbi:MAG: hypothetical protein AB8G23_03595 [Myxococcota bacterium]
MADVQAAADKVELVIRKGSDSELSLGGLRFVACRREIDSVDGGIALYVWSARASRAVSDPGMELLRFDFFRNRPHYHSPADNQVETPIRPSEGQDAQAWGIEQLTQNAAALVAEAGFDGISESIDLEALSQAVPQLASLFSNLDEPTKISRFEVDAKVFEALR